MKANTWEYGWLKELAAAIVKRYIECLYEIHVAVDEAVNYLMSKMPELQAWADVFVTSKPKVCKPLPPFAYAYTKDH